MTIEKLTSKHKRESWEINNSKFIEQRYPVQWNWAINYIVAAKQHCNTKIAFKKKKKKVKEKDVPRSLPIIQKMWTKKEKSLFGKIF